MNESKKVEISINCDLGEGIAQEKEIIGLIDKASIACGGHYGDAESIMNTLQLAWDHDVACGAHPSFPDKENFGRKPMEISHPKLQDSLTSQIELFLNCMSSSDFEIDHVKAHGAFYNLMMNNMFYAEDFIKAYEKLDLNCSIFALDDCEFIREFGQDFPILREAFIDRRYTKEKTLAPRSQPHSLIHSSEIAWKQFDAFAHASEFKSITGESIIIHADTACVHGDNEAAVSILQKIKLHKNA